MGIGSEVLGNSLEHEVKAVKVDFTPSWQGRQHLGLLLGVHQGRQPRLCLGCSRRRGRLRPAPRGGRRRPGGHHPGLFRGLWRRRRRGPARRGPARRHGAAARLGGADGSVGDAHARGCAGPAQGPHARGFGAVTSGAGPLDALIEPRQSMRTLQFQPRCSATICTWRSSRSIRMRLPRRILVPTCANSGSQGTF